MRIRLRTRGKLMLANIGLKIRAVSKTDLLIFLTNNRLLAGTIYVRFLIYLKAVYEQKMKEIYFSTLATKLRYWSIFPGRRSKTKIKNFIKNMYIKLAYEGLPKSLFKFLLIIMSGIGLLSLIGRETQYLRALKYVVRLPHSVRGLGKSR